MESEKIYKHLKSAFCNLMNYKIRGESVEIITPFCTLNNKFISLFISERGNKYIISDGGWVETNMYDATFDEKSDPILKKIFWDLENAYQIKITTDKVGTRFFYKVSDSLESLASDVFDMGNFIQNVINSYCYTLNDKIEAQQQKKFRTTTDGFLHSIFKKDISFRQALDDKPNAKFNAIINHGNKQLTLINYITGSTPHYFQSDIQRSIVYFDLADTSKMKKIIKNRFAIVNDDAGGFQPNKSKDFFALLNEKSTIPFITWKRRDDILKKVS